jgi:hypothetical protein
MAGLGNAQRFLRNDPQAAASMLRSRFMDISDAAYAEGVRIYFPAVPATPSISESAYLNALRSVDAAPAPFERAVDNSLLKSR